MTLAASQDPVVVHIVSALFNGAAYLDEFVRSLQTQTHEEWRLWLRDDGSSDDTLAVCERLSQSEPRIRILHRGGPALGACAAFGSQ